MELADLFEKFRVFVERPGLFAPAAQEEGKPAQLSMFVDPQSRSEEQKAAPEK